MSRLALISLVSVIAACGGPAVEVALEVGGAEVARGERLSVTVVARNAGEAAFASTRCMNERPVATARGEAFDETIGLSNGVACAVRAYEFAAGETVVSELVWVAPKAAGSYEIRGEYLGFESEPVTVTVR